MERHTRGPWEVSADGVALEVQPVRCSENVICSLVGRIDNGTLAEEFTDEDRANARLIAAAPELMEACYTAIGAMVPLRAEYPWMGEIVESIQAAVLKATRGG